jgi:hypothetical protein
VSKDEQDFNEKSRRLRERVALALPVRVHCRETADYEWHEVSRLVDVTPFGARLRLKRPTERGRLLLLTLPMPRQLRAFDHVEDQYRVWAVVTNLKLLDPKTERGALIEFGVAFVGKHPPRTFMNDPTRRYRIDTVSSGMWTLQEEPDETDDESEKRAESRLNIPIEVTLEVFGDNGALADSESTVTENLSPTGASVFTARQLDPGRYVMMSSRQFGVSIMAAIRERRTGEDGITRLHLQFIGREWPL